MDDVFSDIIYAFIGDFRDACNARCVCRAWKSFVQDTFDQKPELVQRLEAQGWQRWTNVPKLVAFKCQGAVAAVMFSPDGRLVVTASDDGASRVWSTSGRLLRVFDHPRGPVKGARFSHDGTRVTTCCSDGCARLFDLATGQLLVKYVGHTGWIRSVRFSPCDKLLLTASDDQDCRIWKCDSLEKDAAFILSGHVGTVAIARWSSRLQIVSASYDHTARIWDSMGKTLAVLKHRAIVRNASWSRDGHSVITACDDHFAYLWKGGDLHAKFGPHPGLLFGARIFSVGVITCSAGRMCRIWDFNGKVLRTLNGHRGDDVNVAQFSPDEALVLTAADDSSVRMYDMNTKRNPAPHVFDGHMGDVRQAAWSPTGSQVATADIFGNVCIWGQPLFGHPPISAATEALLKIDAVPSDNASHLRFVDETINTWRANRNF